MATWLETLLGRGRVYYPTYMWVKKRYDLPFQRFTRNQKGIFESDDALESLPLRFTDEVQKQYWDGRKCVLLHHGAYYPSNDAGFDPNMAELSNPKANPVKSYAVLREHLMPDSNDEKLDELAQKAEKMLRAAEHIEEGKRPHEPKSLLE